MTDQTIFLFALLVFTLMVIGLVLTVREFQASIAVLRSDDRATDQDGG